MADAAIRSRILVEGLAAGQQRRRLAQPGQDPAVPVAPSAELEELGGAGRRLPVGGRVGQADLLLAQPSSSSGSESWAAAISATW